MSDGGTRRSSAGPASAEPIRIGQGRPAWSGGAGRHGMRRQRSKLARMADTVIGRIEAAEALDKPSYAIETAIARPAQIAGRPSAKIGDALHGTGYGHPVHPMLVTIPIGTWTFALAVDLLAALGVLRNERAGRTAETALKM